MRKRYRDRQREKEIRKCYRDRQREREKERRRIVK
jgi:hypothetical protein